MHLFFDHFVQYVGVNFRRCHAGMTKDFLDDLYIDPGFQHIGGGSVPGIVQVDIFDSYCPGTFLEFVGVCVMVASLAS